MSRLLFNFFTGGLLMFFVLAACAPATVQPTVPSADAVDAQTSTPVVLTVAVEDTEQPTDDPPTSTPMGQPPSLSPSPTLAVFTLTPFPSPTQYIPVGVAAPTSSRYDCMIKKMPVDNTVFKPNKKFDIKFCLRNVSARTWSGASLSFYKGTNMLTVNVTYPLPTMQPGGIAGPFNFDAIAPKTEGSYTMLFKVSGADYCDPYIHIVVKP